MDRLGGLISNDIFRKKYCNPEVILIFVDHLKNPHLEFCKRGLNQTNIYQLNILIVFTFGEKADRRLRRDDATELALLGVTDTAASDFTSEICNKQEKHKLLLNPSEKCGVFV